MKLEINIREGVSGLPFNCNTEAVRKAFGEPEETEELDNPCDGSLESIVWSYEKSGLNFFFDATAVEPILTTVESDNIDTELFGKKIFQLNRTDLMLLMKSNGFEEFEEEDETWGEHRVTFDDAQLDFYFTEDDLTLVSWSCY